MNFETWWLFVLMTFFVSATPGPNMLLVMTTSARHGWRPAVASMAGCMTALMAMMILSAAGLGALLQTYPAGFNTLRLGGAAYLAYLGVRIWRSQVASEATIPAASFQGAGLYRQGFLVASSNPKAILFAAAFLPQFMKSDSPAGPQFTVLLLTFAVIETAWYLVYAAFGARLSQVLQRPRVMRIFNRLTGAVFVGFAALMADLRPATLLNLLG